MKKRLFVRKLFMISLLQFENNALVQVVDFSRVATIFHQISRCFRVFLSHKALVSRRLRTIRGLFESAAGIPACDLTQSRRGAETQSERSGLFLAKVLNTEIENVSFGNTWGVVEAKLCGGWNPAHSGG
jgi:hypothetical protein